jgi:mannose-1-phosphate guanylyltransferase
LKAVILAGGMGKRLRPLTNDRPKPMIEICNLPIIEWQIKWLQKFGISEIIILVGHLKEKIMSHLGDGLKFGLNIRYIDEVKPLGTGGALKNAKNIILENGHNTFFVINGDILTDINPLKLMQVGEHVIALVPLRSTFGIVETDQNMVSQFVEKPTIGNKWINAGVYYFSTDLFRYLPDIGNIEFTALPILVKEHKLMAFKYTESYWRSIDSHKDVDEANDELPLSMN